MASTSRTKGLRLTLGGAPNTPHRITGFPGLYRANSPTPVGGDGDVLSVEDAKRLIADHDARERARKEEWEKFEAEREARGERPDGPHPFELQPCPVELVDVKASEVDEARETARRDLHEARHALQEYRPLNAREQDEHADAKASLDPDESQEG
jgi:hypothetical protein